MSDGTASVGLSGRFPAASVLTDLVDQLKSGVGDVKAPGLPLDKIQSLTSGLGLQLPDTSNWHAAIPAGANQLMSNFPDASTLTKPISAPIGAITDLFSFDFGKFQDGISAQAKDAPEPQDVVSALEALNAPATEAVKLLSDPAITHVLETLSNLTGVPAFEQVAAKSKKRQPRRKRYSMTRWRESCSP